MSEQPSVLTALRGELLEGRTTAMTLCDQVLAALDRAAPLNAVISRADDAARQRAAAIDAMTPEARAALPLAGVPIALKDNICVRGGRTTAGSRILADFVAPYDATVVTRLREAGAVIVAKTNCDEFAMGSSNENSAFGPVHNPWANGRTPGGSSGGSAAVVAAGAVPVALGSDTGGSIRQPAALCGVVGIKPTYGRVSRYGLVAYGSSLDQIGPFASSVRDAALVLQCIAGVDSHDATSANEPPIEIPPPVVDLKGVRIGVPRALVAEGVDPDVSAAVATALAQCAALGASLVDIDLPHSRYAVPAYYLVATAEASANLARFDGVRYGHRAELARGAALTTMYETTRSTGFGAEVQRRILLGTYVLSAGYYEAYYRKAQQVRTLITRDFISALAEVDVVAMPTSPTTAFRLGERLEDPVQMYLADVFTVSANLSGLPGISVPCGLDSQGLPIGLQLMGRAFDESGMLRVAAAYEDARGVFPRPAV